MDDREIAHQPHHDVVRLEIRDRGRPRRLLEKPLAIDERPVGLRAEKIFGEDLAESLHVRCLDGSDVVLIEAEERRQIGTDLRAGAGFEVVRTGFDHWPDLVFLRMRSDDAVGPRAALCHNSMTA